MHLDRLVLPTQDTSVLLLRPDLPVFAQHSPLHVGIKVNSAWTYQASFYYKFPTASEFVGDVTIGLQSANSGRVFGSATARISGSQTDWAQIEVSLTPGTSAGDTNNVFSVTVDGAAVAGQTINFAMFSLFPPTFKNRENGMRIDIAEVRAHCITAIMDCHSQAVRPWPKCPRRSSDSPVEITLCVYSFSVVNVMVI